MWYTTPFGEEFFDGSNGQTLICVRKCKHYGTKMFRNMKQRSSWYNSFTTYDRISPSLYQKSQLFLGTAKVENFATLAFSFADSDPTTALHNDISYPSHLESQWRESLFPSLPVPYNSRQGQSNTVLQKKILTMMTTFHLCFDKKRNTHAFVDVMGGISKTALWELCSG